MTIDVSVTYLDYVINQTVANDSARLVQEAIEDSGRSKRSVSDETGIPYPTLNRKLKAQTEFSFTELYLLSEALGVPPWRFTPQVFSRPRVTPGVAA